MNKENPLITSITSADPVLAVLSASARIEQHHDMTGMHLMTPELALATDRFLTQVAHLPTARRTIGATAVEKIRALAADLEPEMVRNGHDFQAIAKSINSELSTLLGGVYSHGEVKARTIPLQLRETFVRAYTRVVPSILAQQIKIRNHVDLANCSLTLLVNLIRSVVYGATGRSCDNANSQYVFAQTGGLDVLTDPTLWAIMNAACDGMELNEGPAYSKAFHEAMVIWLSKVEVKVYQALYDHVDELEAVYAQNA